MQHVSVLLKLDYLAGWLEELEYDIDYAGFMDKSSYYAQIQNAIMDDIDELIVERFS